MSQCMSLWEKKLGVKISYSRETTPLGTGTFSKPKNKKRSYSNINKLVSRSFGIGKRFIK